MENEELYLQLNITPSCLIHKFRDINDDNLKTKIFKILYNLKIKIINEKNAQEQIEELLSSSNEEELLFIFHLYLLFHKQDKLSSNC